MSYLKRGVCSVLAIVATASMQPAAADVIDSYHAYVTTTGSTHTDIVDGANVSWFDAYDTSSVDVNGGEVSWLTLHGSATATISGGDIAWLRVFDNGTASITGLLELSWLVVSETAHVDIYATNTTYSNGILSGTWLDGSLFEFWAVLGSPDSGPTFPAPTALPSNIRILSSTSVPEPSTMMLLGLGLLGVGVAKRSRTRSTARA